MKYEIWELPAEIATVKNSPIELTSIGLTPLLSHVLSSRSIQDEKAAIDFISEDPSQLHDPWLLKDMDKAVRRIELAISRKEKVFVYGDYDVDGITASCLVCQCLTSLGLDCDIYIPDRVDEGYGLNIPAVQRLAEMGVGLIITVDCGVTGFSEVIEAKRLGVDIIITDHHECLSSLPEAVAVISPKRPDCNYPNRTLAGVGVAFKLVAALLGDQEKALEKYSDFVALGTVADVMPLVSENRYLVKIGLKKLKSNPSPGLNALIKETSIDERISSTSISYGLAPRINASGRMGHSNIAVDLLLNDDVGICGKLAESLCQLNRERQRIEQEIYQDAMDILKEQSPKGVIVLAGEGWHQGVIGIVASRISEHFSLPTIMISLDNGIGKGSCRSFGNFNIFEALKACSHLLENFGGHAQAAGLSIVEENLAQFRKDINEFYSNTKTDFFLSLPIDLIIGDITLLRLDNIETLSKLEPCGSGNPTPTLAFLGTTISSIQSIGAGKHTKFQIEKHGRVVDCIFFSRQTKDLGVRSGDFIDIAFYPQINEFRGRRSLQLHVADLRPSVLPGLFERLLNGGEISEHEAKIILPERSDFISLWKRLVELGDHTHGTIPFILEHIGDGSNPARDFLCLTVFAELGLIKLETDMKNITIELSLETAKVDLDSSKILSNIKMLAQGGIILD
ncbi:single-stranded-DNA-specific exonuclease RecJ [Clostridiaceae bacterium OttesenSCG-928-D20]|nr:single-stranded-DNA-specific exonuclease RecJ [Clostridiaceae bacterium OttesenSCG-928-D20]